MPMWHIVAQIERNIEYDKPKLYDNSSPKLDLM